MNISLLTPTAHATTGGRRPARAVGVLAASLALLGLTACSTTEDAAAPAAKDSEAAVRVVATTTQICDYVTQIISGAETAPAEGGATPLRLHKTAADGTTSDSGASAADASVVDLTCVLAPNASAHDHELTRAQMKAFSDADLLLVNGVDLEHFLDAGIEASGFHGTLGVTTGVLGAADKDDLEGEKTKEASLPYTVDRGTKTIDVAPWPFPPEDGETQAEFRFDPHVWTSPKNAAIQVSNIGGFLGTADPDHKAAYTAAAGAYAAQLDSLATWAQAAFDSVPVEHRVLFTSHDAFGYLSKDFGVKFIGAALSDFNSQQDATAEHIAEAAKTVKDSGAVAIFAENSTNPKSLEAVGKNADVRVISGEDALYGDSLGPAGTEGETYIGSIIHNVRQLVTAWGGTPPALPADLQAADPAK
ncbi:zinc ABC transporter substrate-binding protein [Corynebacterium sp. 13CS0277]|uniref:metal ABC transporter substrate-binding protein n=1 Tax=Corynebacterium sp. 13CS0277 TaxID=2071994 RepID=UPI000D034D04|nr:metal ABC transporter substrate-binding protein [Corynebacterium sp. 13CS0277]PRQ11376.1 zinc ABC transporter substrate-binding protein [Corynebacterium sp. 13CS0277]